MANDTTEDVEMEDDYNEEEDEDFNPEARPLEKEASSSEESNDEEVKPGTKKRIKGTTQSGKRQRTEDASLTQQADLDFDNSGDETIIKKGKKRQAKKSKGNDELIAEDSGGEGGFVQTRTMRAAADLAGSRRDLKPVGKVTADIDAVWARLISGSIAPTTTKPQDETLNADTEDAEMITIKRTYNFAGKIHTETKVVPRSSAQAQAYLATKDQRAGAEDVEIEEPTAIEAEGKKGPEGQILSKPQRRISAWDSNPTGFVKALPAAPTIARATTGTNALKVTDKQHLGDDAQAWHRASPELVMRAGRAVLKSVQGTAPLNTIARQLKAQKLNVVDKSKLDWAEHVDIEGAREELEKAKKDKTSYLERRDFLDRVEGMKEDERAKARGTVR